MLILAASPTTPAPDLRWLALVPLGIGAVGVVLSAFLLWAFVQARKHGVTVARGLPDNRAFDSGFNDRSDVVAGFGEPVGCDTPSFPDSCGPS